MLLKQQILDVAASGGPLSRAISGFELRPEQQSMIVNVVDAYNLNQITLIEAGTGTGKSLAYLLPALAWAAQTQEKTVISTHTLNLQEQLVFKDIPELVKALQYPLQAVLVKGMGNYVCLRKMNEALYEFGFLPDLEKEEIEQIDAFCRHSAEASKSDLPFVPSHAAWEKVSAESENCTMMQCPYYEQCYFVKARRKAQDANILVVNHHLLFCDLFKRLEDENYSETAILPPYKRIIFDEAHHIEEIATEYFADRLQRFDLMRAIGKLNADKQGSVQGKLPLLKEKIQNLYSKSAPSDIKQIVTRLTIDLPAMRHVLSEKIHEMFDLFADCMQSFKANTTKYAAGEVAIQTESKLRLLKEYQLHPRWTGEIVPMVQRVIELINQYNSSIRHLETDLKMIENERLQEQTRIVRMEIAALIGKFEIAVLILTDLLNEWNDSRRVRWVEIQPLRTLVNIHLVNAELDISKSLVEGLFSKFATIILCSATLTSNKTFSFIRKRLGLTQALLPHRKITEHIYDSPFDYKKQVLLAIPADMPPPNHEAFNEAAFENIWQAILACSGQAFILFTSYTMLKQCHQHLARRLEEHRFPLLQQGEESRQNLLKKFKKTPKAVLFGTDSFWEGVDVTGDALRCVVIVKIPFQVPNEPIIQARTEKILAEGGNPFYDYSIPQAIVKFKQGFGRLIRQKWDRGVIVCLDTRLISKGYGKLFLNSLPASERLFINGNLLWPQMHEFYRKTYHFVKKGQ